MTDKNVFHVMYLLHLLAPFTAWLLAIVAVIIGAVERPDVRGTYLESHVAWLSRTFWFGLLWIVICSAITFVLIITLVGILVAWLPWAARFIWDLYRVIRR